MFTIANFGDRDLRIAKIESPCGCEEVSLGSKRVRPNQFTTLTLRFVASSATGQQARRVDVLSNDRATPVESVELHWYVQGPPRATPHTLFLSASLGQTIQRTAVLSDVRGEQTRLEARSNLPFLSAVIVPTSLSGALRLLVGTQPSAPVGLWSGSVLVFRGNEAQPVLAVPVVLSVRGRFRVSPPAVLLTNGNPGETRYLTIDDESHGVVAPALRVDDMLPSCLSASLEKTSVPGQHRLAVRLTASWDSRALVGSVKLATSAPEQPTIEIPVVFSQMPRGKGGGQPAHAIATAQPRN